MIEIKEMMNTATKEEFINKKVLICQLQGFRQAVSEFVEIFGEDDDLLFVQFGGELLALLMGLISEDEFDSFMEELIGINPKKFFEREGK